jgi:long-chain acyl-CoA synthetase
MHLTQGLHRSLQQRANELVTIFGARKQTWRTFVERVARLAGALVSIGLKPGERVAVIALNSDRYIEAFYAIAWAGGVIVPGNTRWALGEHAYGLTDAGARLLLVDATFAGLIMPLRQTCAAIEAIYLGDGEAPRGAVAAEDLIATSAPIDDRCARDDALAGIFYTGGTTGHPKGVMLSHRSIISSCFYSMASLRLHNEPVYLHAAPMFHVGDTGLTVTITMVGGTHVVIPSFNAEAAVQAIVEQGVTEILLVPTMFGILHQYLGSHTADLSSVKNVIYGASPITESLLEKAMEIFPNAAFYQGYGQTELSPGATLLMPEFHLPRESGKSYLRSAGRAMVGVDLKIVDETLAERPRGEVGEVAVRSDGVMLGYWGNPELTRQTMVDGWVRTGDAGYMDEEGFLFLVDRMKDMIVSGGENIFSAEVENALSSHANVLECAVIGVPDNEWGERVHAVVRLKIASSADAAELIAHCRTLIAGYKVPRTIEFRDEPLPLSAAGKVLKTELRKPYWPQGGRGVN